ncbi:MAG: YicC family protein [Opitutaceae bacterium]|nr:YicC family protein [Opitutaceae bacterium]
MNSMTGYGRSSAQFQNLEISIEAHSVNRKSLDAITSIPREWQILEGGLLALLKKQINRGRVSINIQAQFGGDNGSEDFDTQAISGVFEQFKTVSKDLDVDFNASADLLFQLALYAKKNQVLPDAELVKETVYGAFEDAVGALVSMRKNEGMKLSEDLQGRVKVLISVLEEIRSFAEDSVANYREVLLQRLSQAELDLDLEDERVLKEIALFADRSDISEEITRLDSHLDQLAEFLSSEGPIGRKIDFLLQEMNREINTVGSKSNDIRISRQVIDFKNELERFREQIANIE